MRVGYCIALGFAVLAGLAGALFCWDVQDGEYSGLAVYLAVAGGVLAVVLGLMPGAPVMFRRYAPPGAVAQWRHETPTGTRRVWAGAGGLGMALAHSTDNYLQGQPFFSLRDLFVLGVGGLLLFFMGRRLWPL